MMKFSLLLLLCLSIGLLGAVTIYDIQYTTVAGSGTYPSLLNNQIVTTQGIVTAIDYNGFYISQPEGGPWKSIFIYTRSYSAPEGALVTVTGTAFEFYGMTEIKSVTSCVINSTGNPIPPATAVNTSIACSEPYESVLTEVHNATVLSVINQYDEWTVSDGSGGCYIGSEFFSQSTLGSLVTIGVPFDSIRGIVNYDNVMTLNPRYQSDIQLGAQTVVVTLPAVQVSSGAPFVVPVNVSNLAPSLGLNSYHFQLSYNPNNISYDNYSTTNTLSSIGTVMATTATGSLDINFVTNGMLVGQGVLLSLNFSAVAAGTCPLNASNFTFNTTPVMIINQGLITVGGTGSELIDSLSVIQRPLLNIPAIVIPGETFEIECAAPQSTTGWTAQLSRGTMLAELPITGAMYETTPARWVLTATVPNVNVFEMYDLKVNASGGINDKTRHSVQVVPSRKTNYYFAHVTDVHMPSHIFYPEPGWDTDSTETVDLREVINDLNVVRPEFVLVTGDLTNQGPLEEFQNQREYSKAKRLLGELQIPCYLVTGNHDIGGWDDPPMPDGSARKNWWKNFGWSWLDKAVNVTDYRTQDYSFDYGPVHFTGMESYDNYDNYQYSVYGSNSFTAPQMTWLQTDLAASDAETKVLFYHFDFNEELNLTGLGIDMALWGHIHYDSGSIYTTPYNISTRSTCDGNRSYRIIRVNNTTLQPLSTVSAGSAGNNINITYTPDNYGFSNTVTATVVNNQFISYENAVVKFIMPSSDSADYEVTNGVLEQVDRSGEKNVCYVRINLTSNSTVTTSISWDGNASNDNVVTPVSLNISAIYPNPFKTDANINVTGIKGQPLTLKVYNLRGELVRTVFQGKQASESQGFRWDGLNSNGQASPSGIYLIKLTNSSESVTRRVVHLK